MAKKLSTYTKSSEVHFVFLVFGKSETNAPSINENIVDSKEGYNIYLGWEQNYFYYFWSVGGSIDCIIVLPGFFQYSEAKRSENNFIAIQSGSGNSVM